MRRIAMLLLLALSFVIPTYSQTRQAVDFHKDLQKATLAIYERFPTPPKSPLDDIFDPGDAQPSGFSDRFICTATVVKQVDEDEYVLLSAGHCFTGDSGPNLKYYVSEGISRDPTLQRVKLLKYANSQKYDYALLELVSPHQYPVIDVSQGDVPPVETPLVNVNYSLGLTQQFVKGYVGSEVIKAGETDKYCHRCVGRFIAEIGMGPGASGSAVVDDNTHQLVGIVEAGFSEFTVGSIVMPLGKAFDNFMIDDTVMEKLPPSPAKKESVHVQKKTESRIDRNLIIPVGLFILSMFCFYMGFIKHGK